MSAAVQDVTIRELCQIVKCGGRIPGRDRSSMPATGWNTAKIAGCEQDQQRSAGGRRSS